MVVLFGNSDMLAEILLKILEDILRDKYDQKEKPDSLSMSQ